MIRKLAALVVLAGLAVAGWTAWDLYRPYRGFSGAEKLEIAPGMGTLAIADLLVERGVLAHRGPFLMRAWAGHYRRRLKAGEYLFDHPLRPIDVYRKLVAGDVYLYAVVVPEGSDRFDIARILADRLGIAPTDFLRATEQTALIHDLDPQAPSLEGYLFPDTYRYPRHVTPAAVVLTMVGRFRHVLQAHLREGLSDAAGDLHTVVTLASLVEKETPDPAERPEVAGVFERRLKLHMLLQCDPTVIYAARLAERRIGTIRGSDLRFDSLFNTYVHGGLPPGPIASPGEASLRAAFHPADGDALYFVSNNHGSHVFAKSLEEHEHNVAVSRRQRRKERKSK